jgi:hypothetical protein
MKTPPQPTALSGSSDQVRVIRVSHAAAILVAFLLVFGSCTASQPHGVAARVLMEPIPGFWRGLWHGFITPIAFLVSLVSNDVRIYAFPNAGRWYDFGFMLGIGGFSGGMFAGARPRKVQG